MLLRFAVLGLLVLGVAPGSANAAVCSDHAQSCTVNVATSIGNPQFPPLCFGNFHVVQLNVQILCGDCEVVNPPIYVCGAQTQAFTINACGKTFTLEPKPGHQWEEALTDCSSFRVQ